MQLDLQNSHRDTMDCRADYLRSIARRSAACVAVQMTERGLSQSLTAKQDNMGQVAEMTKRWSPVTHRGNKHEGGPPLHSFNAYNVQNPSGTDKLAVQYNTVPMLLQISQMPFDGSLSISWRCEVSQQICETNHVTASETSVLDTHRTNEKTWIS